MQITSKFVSNDFLMTGKIIEIRQKARFLMRKYIFEIIVQKNRKPGAEFAYWFLNNGSKTSFSN